MYNYVHLWRLLVLVLVISIGFILKEPSKQATQMDKGHP